MDKKNRELSPVPEIEVEVFDCSSEAEAREKAAELWEIDKEDVETKILSEDKKLFGLLGHAYKVQVMPIAPVSYIKSCYFVNEMLDKMDLDIVPELSEDGIINLVGEDAGVVIGRYGETLKALEYLTNLVCHEDMSTRRVRFDCGGYRGRREKTLTRLAESVAREAVRRGESIMLEPMLSWERRIVHLALRDNNAVETRSVGEEPSRRVTVHPVNTDSCGSRSPRARRRRRSAR